MYSGKDLDFCGVAALHQRAIPGIVSREMADWHGTKLRGSYFIKNTLREGGSDNGTPVILLPGGFDPVQGEYSTDLVRLFLEEAHAHRPISGYHRSLCQCPEADALIVEFYQRAGEQAERRLSCPL